MPHPKVRSSRSSRVSRTRRPGRARRAHRTTPSGWWPAARRAGRLGEEEGTAADAGDPSGTTGQPPHLGHDADIGHRVAHAVAAGHDQGVDRAAYRFEGPVDAEAEPRRGGHGVARRTHHLDPVPAGLVEDLDRPGHVEGLDALVRHHNDSHEGIMRPLRSGGNDKAPSDPANRGSPNGQVDAPRRTCVPSRRPVDCGDTSSPVVPLRAEPASPAVVFEPLVTQLRGLSPRG